MNEKENVSDSVTDAENVTGITTIVFTGIFDGRAVKSRFKKNFFDHFAV